MDFRFYILSIQPDKSVNDKIVEELDLAEDWIQVFPHTIIIVSIEDSQYWQKRLKPFLPNTLFFISELNEFNWQGWLPKWIWERLKEHKGNNL
jgi:hypothetical protein